MTSNARFFRSFDVNVDQKETYVLKWAIMECRVFKILPVQWGNYFLGTFTQIVKELNITTLRINLN